MMNDSAITNDNTASTGAAKDATSSRFDGVSDGVVLGGDALVEGSAPLTISMKVRTTATGEMTLLSQGNGQGETAGGGYYLGMDADGKVMFTLGDGTTQQWALSSTTAINDGEWHHIAVQRDGRTGMVWVDGEVQTAVNGNEVIALTSNATTTLGYSKGNNARRFQGDLASVRISNQGLSETDIFGYAAPNEAEVGTHRSELTRDADTILGMGFAGQRVANITVTGRDAFGLYVNGSVDGSGNPTGDRSVGAAATEWGAGRVVLHTQGQALNWNYFQGQMDNNQFFTNTMKWLTQTDDKSIRIIAPHSGTRSWLRANGYTNIIASSEWWLWLDSSDVFIGSVENADHVQEMREFVKGGGSLFTAASAYNGHEYTKQVLEGSGLQLTDDKGWIGSYGAIATEYSHAVNALDVFKPGSITDPAAQREAGKALSESIETLSTDDPLRAQIAEAALSHTSSINPTRENPYTWDSLDRAALEIEAAVLLNTAPAEVEKHRTAESAYGVIPTDAPRVDKTVTIDLSDPLIHDKRHSTGVYVAPGEVVTVTVPDHLVDQGAYFQINTHHDNTFTRSELQRFPTGISRSFEIDSSQVEIANAFGGFAYLLVPGNKSLGVMELAFQNTLDAPHFVLGETTDAEWNASIKNNPAPYAEIVTDNLVITLPSEHVRDVDNPTAIAMMWEQVELAQEYLRGIENEARRGEGMNIDAQISWGAAHSGYPTQAPQDEWASSITDYESLSEHGNWGWFHELGHQHQRGYTHTDGDNEHTVNIFTMGAMDALGVLPDGDWADMWDAAERVDRIRGDRKGFRNAGSGTRLVMNAQLSRVFGWEAYRNVYLTYENDSANWPNGEQARRDQWLIRWSEETGRDLTPFFDAWEYGHSQDAKDAIADLNLPEWSMIEVLAPKTKILNLPNTEVTFDLHDATWSWDINGPLSFTKPTTVNNGTLDSLGDGKFKFTPDTDYAGRQTLDFGVTNTDGGSAVVSIDLQTATEIKSQQAVDTILSSSNVNRNYSNDVGLSISDDGNGSSLHGLLRFEDVIGNDGEQVPEGSEVISATLRYSLRHQGTVVNFHKMLVPWNDTDTWASLTDGIQTDDIEAASTADFSVNARDYSTHTVDVTDTIKEWLANPESNHGWAIMPTNGFMQFASSEIDRDSRKPTLYVTYAPADSLDAAINKAPVTTGQSISTNEDTILAIDVLSQTTDADGPDHSIDTVDLIATVVSQASYGRVHRLPDGKLGYIPNDDFNGTDSFTYSVSDGIDNSNIAIVNITVNDINDAPIALIDKHTTAFNQSIQFNPLTNDTEVDGTLQADSVVFVGAPSGSDLSDDGKTLTIQQQGTFTLDASGNVQFDPFDGFSGNISPISYQVTDDDGETTVGKINITVQPKVSDQSTSDGSAIVDYTFEPSSDNSIDSEVAVTDTIAPTVTSVAPQFTTISDDNLGEAAFSLTVNFSEEMNTAYAPVITFPMENPNDSVHFNEGSWQDEDTYVALYDVLDANETIIDVDILVASAQDTAGNVQTFATFADLFSIDTVPTEVVPPEVVPPEVIPPEPTTPEVAPPETSNNPPIEPPTQTPVTPEGEGTFFTVTPTALELTRWDIADTLQLHGDSIGVDSISEILIFKTDVLGLSRQEIGRFSLLEDRQLSPEYAPVMSLSQDDLNEGDMLEFDLIENGSRHTASMTPDGSDGTLLDFGNGTSFSLSFTDTAGGANLLINNAAAIDLTQMGTTVTMEFSVYREAAFDSTVGFYVTDFADGSIVIDELLGTVLRPGDAGYKEAAMSNQLDVQLSGSNGRMNTFSTEIAGGDFLGSFLTVGGGDPMSAEVFFSHMGANSDGSQHVKMLGDNTFGFEDMVGLGDRDYNDMVVQFSQVN